MSHIPHLSYYPNHPMLVQRMEEIRDAFSDREIFSKMKRVAYNPGNGNITIRFTGAYGNTNAAKELYADMTSAWEIIGLVFEADLWDDLIQKIRDRRIRKWAGQVIWWHRHDASKDQTPEVKKSWSDFEKKYEHIQKLLPSDVEKAAKSMLTRADRRAIKANGEFRRGILDNRLREDRIYRRTRVYRTQLLEKELTEIGAFLK